MFPLPYPSPAHARSLCTSTGRCHPLPRLLSSTRWLLSSAPLYHHIIISSYHHISEPKSASQFWPKSQEKNRNGLLNPSTKSHRDLIFGTSGVTFRDERHGNALKSIASRNRHFTCFVMTFEILQNLQTAEKSRG